eukprot:842644-Pelagomonas_calceolata.AAC.1
MSDFRKYTSVFSNDFQRSREQHYSGIKGHVRYVHAMLCASLLGATGHECTAKFQRLQRKCHTEMNIIFMMQLNCSCAHCALPRHQHYSSFYYSQASSEDVFHFLQKQTNEIYHFISDLMDCVWLEQLNRPSSQTSWLKVKSHCKHL